ncbi:MAG: hypothetical protein IJT18_05295 [Oscillospiraceae bacterium]|nr:hypothetical protein [Oscillospiraceae bacterium]
MMPKRGLRVAAFISLLTALACLFSLTAATYAWFTSNQTVSTSRVDARTGDADVKLEISSYGGAAFRGAESAAPVQVNNADLEWLFPVSTDDLQTFVYNPVADHGMAKQFVQVKNESYFYHGRVYLRATAQNVSPDAKLALYFDQSVTAGGLLAQSDARDRGLLLNAARLGLIFGGSSQPPAIFYLTDEENEAADQAHNTVLNGTLQPDGKVLTMRGSSVVAVPDPSKPLSDAAVSISETETKIPGQPLLEMEVNKIYPVDIYFYLEGCDPDCSDSISYEGVSLHLSFFGILQ